MSATASIGPLQRGCIFTRKEERASQPPPRQPFPPQAKKRVQDWRRSASLALSPLFGARRRRRPAKEKRIRVKFCSHSSAIYVSLIVTESRNISANLLMRYV